MIGCSGSSAVSTVGQVEHGRMEEEVGNVHSGSALWAFVFGKGHSARD